MYDFVQYLPPFFNEPIKNFESSNRQQEKKMTCRESKNKRSEKQIPNQTFGMEKFSIFFSTELELDVYSND